MVARQIRSRGVRNAAVLTALLRIPRHEFVPEDARPDAYADSPLPIGDGQTISQPYVVARMTEMLDARPGRRILEVGTGSGYQTAVLAELGGEVYSIEAREPLLDTARATLERLGYDRVRFRHGDGAAGWPEFAPFEGIIVTACASEVPGALAGQLAAPGRMVVPIGVAGGEQRLVTVTRNANGEMDIAEGLPVRFVMMTAWKGGSESNR